MHEKQIAKMVNDLFYNIVDTEEVREQKEELRIHVAERVADYMGRGMDFDSALAQAKADLGDPEELVSGFERKKAVVLEEVDDDYGINIRFRVNRIFARLTPLAPFIYLIIGLTQSTWREWGWIPETLPNWWWWGWVIIPIIPILSSGSWSGKIVAVSPFIYILLGVFFGWWLWGWLIIPISGILFSGWSGGGKKKKKKKKRKWEIYKDWDFKIEGVGELAHDSEFVHDIVNGVMGNSNKIRREVRDAMEEAREDVLDAMQEVRDDLDEDLREDSDRRN